MIVSPLRDFLLICIDMHYLVILIEAQVGRLLIVGGGGGLVLNTTSTK